MRRSQPVLLKSVLLFMKLGFPWINWIKYVAFILSNTLMQSLEYWHKLYKCMPFGDVQSSVSPSCFYSSDVLGFGDREMKKNIDRALRKEWSTWGDWHRKNNWKNKIHVVMAIGRRYRKNATKETDHLGERIWQKICRRKTTLGCWEFMGID